MNIQKTYDPNEIEKSIYKKWIESGYFNPDICVKKNIIKADAPIFSIMMPPPNVTGVLHLGHAFENTIMDIKTRFMRMRGHRTLWLPGTDHAAVATQAKVESILIKDKGHKNPRVELGREQLLTLIREYAEKSKATILEQIKSLGSSCDWSRLAYTFDTERSLTVNEMFVRMYNDGLIYKGYRVINWSVKGQSTCSDDELEYEPRKATLYYFKYSADFPITIASTRPETKLGDTAVAVHPDDERYRHLVGKIYNVDVGADKPRAIKIIGDACVDPNYGTGALGVTPAHSQIDFELYEKHKLELIQIIGIDGLMTSCAGKDYQGLTSTQAREKFVTWLESKNLIVKKEEIEQNVSVSDRFKDIVEPLPLTQWFVAVNKKIHGKNLTLKDLMRSAVTTGHNNDPKQIIKIMPDRFAKVYMNWIDNLRDWCISRQIWWGHQLPVWYHKASGEVHVSTDGPTNPEEYERDSDTLDTWFSSGTWTFSTLGWPKTNAIDLQTYHPTSWMQMGYDILFFWMARMILMSTYALDQLPFHKVYIHGNVRDKEGRKFSKSLNNGIDPLDVIKDYGTDALRLSLVSDLTPGQDSRFYMEKVETFRNLVNKIWNISRFILLKVEKPQFIETTPTPKTLSEKWILDELNILVKQSTELLEQDQFSLVTEKLREFTWTKLADWYLEIAKIEKNNDDILLYILQNLLSLWHPYAPFITEQIWSLIPNTPCEFLMTHAWPQIKTIENHEITKKDFCLLQELIVKIRNARNEQNIPAGDHITIFIKPESQKNLIREQEEVIKKLTRASMIEITEKLANNEGAITVDVIQAVIKTDNPINTESLREKNSKEIEQLEDYVKKLQQKYNDKEFIKNAPPQIIEKEKEKLNKAQEKLNTMKRSN